jgi:hypothetical protein
MVIVFNENDVLQSKITAVAWRGEVMPFGTSIDDLVVWFSVCTSLLFSCIFGMCCFVALRRHAPTMAPGISKRAMPP